MFDVAAFVALHQTGRLDREWHLALIDHGRDVRSALAAIGGGEAVHTLNRMTSVRTPFAAPKLIAEFKARPTKIKKNTVDQYTSSVMKFAESNPDPDFAIETFSSKHVQQYLNDRTQEVQVKTIDRDLAGLRKYWKFLVSQDLTGRLHLTKPFEGLVKPEQKAEVWDPTALDFDPDASTNGRTRFAPEQVCDLWDAADRAGNEDLRDLIVLLAYTGGRREGCFTVHTKTVFLDNAVPYIRLNEKTAAGRRGVPIHPDIYPLLARRVSKPQRNGYLFRPGDNKRDSKSSRMTNRMADLLAKLGYRRGAKYGFHSLRRTFTDMLQAADISELKAAKIIGHSVNSMTYGLYAGDLDLEHSRRTMFEAIKFPRKPPV